MNHILATAPKQLVITWQAPNGLKLHICQECEKRLKNDWPRNQSGEYRIVYRGLHPGRCDICQK